MENNKKYWKGVEELNNDPEFVRLKNNEFAEPLPLDKVLSEDILGATTPRRDFLKFLGFGVAAASLAACEAPVKKTIPYLIKPEEITPGVANWYASSYFDGRDYCSVLVKTREGRPIKIEGNKLSGVTKGGTNARTQAAVLSLYDGARLKGPLANNEPSSWENVDSKIKKELAAISEKKGNIRILSSTIISPSTKAVIATFLAKYPTARHITYDVLSASGIINANKLSFGVAAVPTYHFEKAMMVVGFEADFLSGWLAPIEYSKQYVQNRKLRGKKNMSRHVQFETALSLTGSNADKRIAVKPSEQGALIAALYNKIAGHAGGASVKAGATDAADSITAVAKELWDNKGKALVVSGSNDVNIQVLVNGINAMLESYGNTIDLNTPSNLQQGMDAEVIALVEEMKKGEVAGLILYNVNPVYTYPKTEEFKSALSKVGLKISLADRQDETAALVNFVCPDHHILESWGDAEPKKGMYSLVQPTIAALFATRQAQVSLLNWAGNDTADYHEYVKAHWEKNIVGSGMDAWNKALQDGVHETAAEAGAAHKFAGDANAAANALPKVGGGIEIVLYEKAGLGIGNQANNPWLQELPDPISKICWDNYLAVPMSMAKEKGWEQGTMVELKANGQSVKVPVLIQPGQARNTASLAIGYGRTHAGKAANNVGFNAYPFAMISNGSIQWMSSAEISATSGDLFKFAATQTHHTMMGRAPVRETTLKNYINQPKEEWNEPALVPVANGNKTEMKKPSEVDIWATLKKPGFIKPNHHWGMAIDLNSCIGCGSCVVSCNAENNVPVVGKDEIRRSREMHWIRIDRYYSSDAAEGDHKGMEQASDNPSVVFQPMLCQQCNHAPCETVCPVAATTHSSEGLNQMAYNRCVGTRYCANNCPYKVRRFNWFKYSDNGQFDFNMNDNLGKMVLNPDVVVRSRGVMEKCSFCVQRIQEGKLVAKKESRRPVDGEIQTACAQACPTNAIVFGDLNDPKSEVSQFFAEERSYTLLEELNTQPNIMYQVKVRNT
jgi:MoCo/4Fe-4S cofactor protein with predicted Tat translocation signal